MNHEDTTNALTEEILKDFIVHEIQSLKLTRDAVEERLEYDLIEEIKSEPSPLNENPRALAPQ